MDLDIRTIVFILFLVSALFALMLLIYWKTQKTYDGFNFWTWGSVTISLGLLLIMLRGTVPDMLSIVVANLLFALCIFLRADSISRFFRGHGVLPAVYAILLPFLFLFLWFTFGSDSIIARTFLTTIVFVPGLVFMGYVAIQSAQKENWFISRSFGVSLIGLATVYFVRFVYWAILPPETIFSNDNFNSIFFVLLLIQEILAGVMFLLLNMVRAQGQVTENEERYRVLSENLPDFIVVHDGGKILYANQATVRMTGISRDALAGTPVLSLIAPESRPESAQVIREILSSSTPAKPHEILIPIPGGRTRTCIVQSVPVRFGQRPAIMSVLTDITERKQVEEALRTVNRKLNLLSGITRHDIKNQLMALNAYLEIGRESAGDPAEVMDMLERGMKITETIDRQISFTRDYESLGVSSPVWQDAKRIADEEAAALPMQDIRFKNQCAGIEIFADPLFSKVFYNLIDNSLRYGGEMMTTISIHCEETDHGMLFVVEDDGDGISAEDKQFLFTKGFGKNTGLGLFFIREILSITGITIEETGKPGTGARFEILVPDAAWRRTAPGDTAR
jgi:PAS domain S-box-containing protein